ncbi:unnamed protein product [Lathyrus sativus]|nr:unnamed protein product [Lathyrus sativus]
MSSVIDELWKRFKSLDVIGKGALKSRIFELAFPTMTSMCPPAEKVKTKEGVKKKDKKPVGSDVYIDHSYHDVVSDGNCGFRVIASLHGYGEDGWPMVRRDLGLEIIHNERSSLYANLFTDQLAVVRESLMIEEFDPQPPHKWLTLPDMGYMIVNRYNVVLVCLGIECWTFFPMVTSFSPNVAIYCIGFVNKNNWVNMKEEFPLPPVIVDWKKFRSPAATSWMLGLAERLQHCQQLTPILPTHYKL